LHYKLSTGTKIGALERP